MATKTSSLTVSLIDKVSGPAKKVAGALRGINGSDLGKGVRGADKLGKSLEDLRRAAGALGKVKPAVGWGDSFDRQLSKMKLTARELETLRRSFERFNSTLRNGPAIHRSPAFQADAFRAWRVAAVSEIEKVRQARLRLGNGSGFGRFLVTTGTAYGAGRGLNRAVKAGASEAREGARDYLGGLTDGDSARLKRSALDLSLKYRSVDATTFHERLRDTALAMGSVDKALAVADTIGRSAVVLQSLKGKDAAVEEGRRFFSALDNLGKNVDPDQMRRLVDGWTKALGVEGADLNMGALLAMARTAKSGGASLDERFLTTVAPAIMMDLGPERLGTALGSSVSQAIGGRATKVSKAAQTNAGLRDKKGNFLNRDELLTNPFEYTMNRLIPAMEKSKIDINDNVAVTAFMSKIFSNQVVADLFTKMVTQREQYQRKAQQYDHAPGTAAAEELAGKDPFVALAGSFAQLQNVATVLAEPAIPTLTNALNSFNSVVADTTRKLRDDPGLAKAVSTAVGGVALPAAASGAGWLAKTLAGEGTGVIANGLRAGGGALGGLGRLLRWPGVGLAIYGIDAAIEATTGESPYKKAKIVADHVTSGKLTKEDREGIAKHAKALRKAIFGSAFDHDESLVDRRQGLEGDLAKERTAAGNNARNFGTKSAVGASMAQRHARRIAELEARIADLDRQIAAANEAKPGSAEAPSKPSAPLAVASPPQVKAELTGSAQVTGETKIVVEVRPSSSLIEANANAQAAAKLTGQLRTGIVRQTLDGAHSR